MISFFVIEGAEAETAVLLLLGLPIASIQNADNLAHSNLLVLRLIVTACPDSNSEKLFLILKSYLYIANNKTSAQHCLNAEDHMGNTKFKKF